MDNARTRQRVRTWLDRHGYEMDSYGIPTTRDPREFMPDLDSNTHAEIEQWIVDVDAAFNGSLDTAPIRHTTVKYDENGKLLWHVSHPRWGLGISYVVKEVE